MPYVDDIPFAGGDTSADAAKTIKQNVAKVQAKVFDYIQWATNASRVINGILFVMVGATCDEIERDTGLSHQTASARVRELAQAGTIRDSGQRRLTRSGRKAIVWEAV